MRFLFLVLLAVLVGVAIGYLIFKNRIEGYMKYYQLGISCFDKSTRTFNEVLDRDVIASDEVQDWQADAYLKGRDVAKKRFYKARERYEKFIKG